MQHAPAMKPQDQAAEANAIETRRRVVSERMVQHRLQCEMAEELGVSTATISRDVQVVREQWRERLATTYEELRSEEMGKLDIAEGRVWDAVLAGDKSTLWAVDRLLGIMDRRARLMGLDKPVKAQVEVTHQYRAELDVRIAELVASQRGGAVVDVEGVEVSGVLEQGDTAGDGDEGAV